MKKVIIINSDSMGSGDESLGKKLLGAFLRKLWARDEKPDAVICYNSGVKLIAIGSQVLDVLSGLQEAGVDILACGTCIEHYNLVNDIKVGRISNMEEIASILMTAESVVTV